MTQKLQQRHQQQNSDASEEYNATGQKAALTTPVEVAG